MSVDRYTIVPEMSRFTVQAFASGLFSALGHNPTIAIRDFSGEAEFVPGTLEQAALNLKINAGSLAVTDRVSDKDRREMESTMNRDVLETSRYPEIAFQTSSASVNRDGDGRYWVNLVGDLSLHGVTNRQPVSAQITLEGNTLRAHGEFSLKQTAFGIKLVSVAGGTLKLKDEVKAFFDILARKSGDSQ